MTDVKKDVLTTEDKLKEIKEYCEPYKEYMWAAVILGIINDTSFRGEANEWNHT